MLSHLFEMFVVLPQAWNCCGQGPLYSVFPCLAHGKADGEAKKGLKRRIGGRGQVCVSARFMAGRLDKDAANPYPRCFKFNHDIITASVMKIRNSLKSLKSRHRDCRVIRRRGRVYVINKTNRRFKARQG